MRVKPRSSRDGVAGEREGALLVRLTAAPVEGQANAALLQVLGRALGVAPSSLRLLRGTSGRDKLVRIGGLSAAEVRARLAGPPSR